MAMTSLDYPQVLRTVYDEATQTLKVSIESIDMSIELSHADGDSVLNFGSTVNGDAVSGTAIACDNYRKIAVYSVTPVGLLVEASPDNVTWVTIDNTNAVYILKDLCAKFVRMSFSSGTVKYVLQS